MSTGRATKIGSTDKLVRKLGLGLASGLMILAVNQTHAAPGVLAQLPLFLATPVQPNIFFVLDDSGSMNWEVLRRYDGDDGYQYFDYSPENNDKEREHCVGYNVLAYDPSKTYTPWFGLDKDGASFTDQSATAARVNPYTGGSSTSSCQNSDGTINNGNGRTCNLVTGLGGSGAWYVPWEDDGDGEYDSGECSTTNSDRVYVSTLSAEQQTNFANWFSYYRKREYVAKRAVSEIIDGSAERMGFATLNKNDHVVNDGDHVGTQVRDIDDLSVPVNATAAANKKLLLDNLLGVDSSGGTPLRIALQRTGEYFKGNLGSSTVLFGDEPVDDSDSAGGDSPILKKDLGGTCQQNFAIVMSDGYWNGTTSPGVGNTDEDDTDSPYDGQSYADSWGDTLADVAMEYYENDLMPDISFDNEVPIVPIDVASGDVAECDAVLSTETHLHPNCYDTNTAQHLVTYTVAFGVRGTIPETGTGGVTCQPLSRSGTSWPAGCSVSAWPQAKGWTATTVDDMMHAAWNGRGKFLSAKDPDELIDSLQEAINDIAAKNVVSAAAVAVDSASIISGGEVVQGKFDSSYWQGELYSHSITSDGVVATSPTWEAHELLDARGYSTRIAVTYNGSTAIAFDFPADYTDNTNFGSSEISQAQVDDLMYNAPYAVTTTDATEIAANQAFGEQLVAYLKGDDTNEGRTTGKLRDRGGHKLGDIVHSSPVYVGDPNPSLYYDTSYQAWANNTVASGGAKGRQEVIYVGANDGGLHAFDAETGEEIFVFFPHAVFNDDERWGLHYLADRGYEHRYYVDGDITVAEVYGDFDGGGDKWSTILVGMLRGGGRSMFAIDVSDPREFSTAAGVASNILWEFSNTELGFTYGKATLAKMNNDRWAAVFGNGYYPADSATGAASLFIKYLDSATDHKIISTGVGTNTGSDCLDASSNCNGLSTPAVVDLGGDYVADMAYAGDLFGNMWAFDLSSSSASSWGVAYSGSPLFTAKDSSATAQPITTQPAVVLHPTERHSSTSPNTMLFFGSGQYLTESDVTSTATNTFYGIWDSGSAISSARSTALVEQTITPDTLAGFDVRLMSNNPVDYTTHRGWFVDLPDSGEKVISRPIALGSIVIYNTLVPAPSLCTTTGGYSWTMVHNLIDGSEPDFIAYDVSGDGDFDSSDQIDGKNVTGKKSDNPRWTSTIVDGGNNEYFNITPEADKSVEKHQDEPTVGQRSSWGRYHME